MNYIKQYFRIIRFRRNNPLVKSSDTVGDIHYHHIIPKSCGGKDSPKSTVNQKGSNLIGVTPREHYVLHELLVKICKNTKYAASMNSAWWFMSHVKVNGFDVKINSRLYETFSKEFVKTKSIQHSGWHHTAEAKEKISNASRGRKYSDEIKAIFSAAQNRPDVRMKKSLAVKGRKLSKEHKLAISKGNTEEVRLRKSLSTKGIPKSKQAHENMIAAQNRTDVRQRRQTTWNNKDKNDILLWKSRISNALTGRKKSDETKQKMRKSKDDKWKLSQLQYRIKKFMIWCYYLMII